MYSTDLGHFFHDQLIGLEHTWYQFQTRLYGVYQLQSLLGVVQSAFRVHETAISVHCPDAKLVFQICTHLGPLCVDSLNPLYFVRSFLAHRHQISWALYFLCIYTVTHLMMP
ncbi:hypothetical protein KP509_23G083300 [Ceratopteris richardii]|uniref:Uncharacterized protein n=1 Tax=Ceratopteris richardii TaxID=49495 RepID=A0A8T2S3T1_CERRI|nr:hypothetical protein KP509_23G083300 [Ceratopteris richardii]